MSEPFVPPVAPVTPAPPPGAYRVPVGEYAAPVGGYVPPQSAPPSRAMGATAFVASLVATLGAPVVAGLLALRIGLVVSADELISAAGDFVIAALSPARTETLWIEIVFWLGTVLGLFGVVGGIIAVTRRRGRGLGIAAIVVAAPGPILFFLAAAIMFGVGNGLAFAPMA